MCPRPHSRQWQSRNTKLRANSQCPRLTPLSDCAMNWQLMEKHSWGGLERILVAWIKTKQITDSDNNPIKELSNLSKHEITGVLGLNILIGFICNSRVRQQFRECVWKEWAQEVAFAQRKGLQKAEAETRSWILSFQCYFGVGRENTRKTTHWLLSGYILVKGWKHTN